MSENSRVEEIVARQAARQFSSSCPVPGSCRACAHSVCWELCIQADPVSCGMLGQALSLTLLLLLKGHQGQGKGPSLAGGGAAAHGEVSTQSL